MIKIERERGREGEGGGLAAVAMKIKMTLKKFPFRGRTISAHSGTASNRGGERMR